MPALSVRLMVYDERGREPLDAYGGWEPVMDLQLSQEGAHWVRRDDLFGGPASLREAVAVVFEP